jgi:hypothetical protein
VAQVSVGGFQLSSLFTLVTAFRFDGAVNFVTITVHATAGPSGSVDSKVGVPSNDAKLGAKAKQGDELAAGGTAGPRTKASATRCHITKCGYNDSVHNLLHRAHAKTV